jgi:hypothetical protein
VASQLELRVRASRILQRLVEVSARQRGLAVAVAKQSPQGVNRARKLGLSSHVRGCAFEHREHDDASAGLEIMEMAVGVGAASEMGVDRSGCSTRRNGWCNNWCSN